MTDATLQLEDYIRIGDMFFTIEQYPKAAKFYWQAIGAPPQNPAAVLTKFALSSLRSGDRNACMWALGIALALDQQDPFYWSVSAIAGAEIGQFEDALERFKHACELMPQNGEFWMNIAHHFQLMGQYSEAEQAYSRVVALDTLHLRARFYRAMTILTQGRYEEGFREYETRYAVYPELVPKCGKTIWRGQEPLACKTVLLCAEQGAGDGIQFGRYAQWLKDTHGVARVIVLCRPEMINIMRCIRGVNQVVTSHEGVEYDFQAPMMSMPGMSLEAGAPWWGSDQPYLDIPDARTAFPKNGYKAVGFCWQGNPQHGNDKFRSIPRAAFEGFPEPARYLAVNLQNDTDGTAGMINPKPKSLLALAQTIKQLDLVITVDTAIAHIAGALGKPVWMLTASNPDWRWGLEGTATPWYLTMTLFRQEKPLEWQPVIDRVKGELYSWLDKN